MKKLVVISITIILTLGITACGNGTFEKDFYMGLIFSASTGDKTEITYIDAEGKILCKQKFKYADFTSSATAQATIYKNIIYAAPKGAMGKCDEQETVTIDLSNGATTKYDNGDALAGPSCITANDSAFYVCRNLNSTSTVGRHDLKTNKVISHEFDNEKDICIMTIYATNKYIYCSGTGIEKGESDKEYDQYLYILNSETLSLEKKIEIPYEISSFIEVDDKVYFSMEPEFEEDKGDSYLGLYDEEEGKEGRIKIEGAKKFGEIEKMGNSLLLIDSYDEEQESILFEYDLKSKKIVSRVKIDTNISQAQVKDKSLFIYSDDAEDNVSHIYEYRRRDNKFERIKTYDPFEITGGGITTFFLHE